MNHLKIDREANSKHLDELQLLKGQLTKLEKAEIQITNLQSVINRIEQCTYEEKRLALDALDIKVSATLEKVEIAGIIPVDLVPTSFSSQNPMHQRTVMPMFVMLKLVGKIHFN